MHGYFCDTDTSKTPADAAPVLHAATEGLWVTPAELAAFTFPAGHRKLIELLRKQGGQGFV